MDKYFFNGESKGDLMNQINLTNPFKFKFPLITEMVLISSEFIVEGVLMLGVASVGVVLNIIREGQ